MHTSEIKDEGTKYYRMGFNVGISGTDKTTFPAYPPVKTDIKDRWLAGWKKGHESYLINLKHK